MEWFRGHYLNDLERDRRPARLAARAPTTSPAWPPALIYTAGFDPLRDEGQAYADRLTAAGVKTIHREFDSLIHGFVGMRGAIAGGGAGDGRHGGGPAPRTGAARTMRAGR